MLDMTRILGSHSIYRIRASFLHRNRRATSSIPAVLFLQFYSCSSIPTKHFSNLIIGLFKKLIAANAELQVNT
jgi:hypothetical protein